ncbi:uncharacterized protein LOC120295929 [Eucalyptus grandis]|uniref:uncharacterized protein LOC120295929 n=1 Tax=Eucalyptus grandis TaxID=71139 RepID=UPI00192EBEF3|nr:uncharacterized protein LOC120295929 [Eucalyptus grandis]
MDNIEIIWDDEIAAESFHNLKSLQVRRCNKLANIVPSCILGRLKSLESLDILACGSLKVVFKLQPLNPLDRHPITRLPIKKLELYGLPELKCVWEKELHSQVKFQCLRFVTVYGCKNLAFLFPTSIALYLTQLEELEINACGIVELIEKEEGLVPRFVFPKLTSLKLEHLIELKCIYTGKHASYWPALKTLKVCGCDKVEILASHLENEMPLLKQPLFIVEKGAFSNLQELKLESSKWMEIWNGSFLNGEFFCKLRVLELCRISKESAMSASKMKALQVCDCGSLEEISNLEGMEAMNNTQVLP